MHGPKNVKKEIRLSWYSEVHYSVQHSPPLDHILSHMKPIQVVTPCFLKANLNTTIDSPVARPPETFPRTLFSNSCILAIKLPDGELRKPGSEARSRTRCFTHSHFLSRTQTMQAQRRTTIPCRQELSILIQEQHADIGLRVCNFVYASTTHTGIITVHRSSTLHP